MKYYDKDYSDKTAEEWLAKKNWKGFLMRVPLDKPKGYPCKNSNNIMSIRVIASQMSNDPNCKRKFSVVADFDTKVITITATKK